jgi:hypothetical protein
VCKPFFSVIFGLDPEIQKIYILGTGYPAFAEDDKRAPIVYYAAVRKHFGYDNTLNIGIILNLIYKV